jgi:multiple sugar transport system permease protein
VSTVEQRATPAPRVVAVNRRRRSTIRAERRLAALMVSPTLIVIAVVAAYPIGYAFWLSLHEYSVIVPGLSRWYGLDNYKAAFSDPTFWSALETTLVFSAISVALELVIGLGMALMMHCSFRGRSMLRAIVLIPWSVLTVVTAFMWQMIVNPQLGPVNGLLGAIGLPHNTVWLGQEPAALGVMIFADVWKTAPFMALLLLAGLQTIPQELYEAAEVDGASAWQRFSKITLPLLRPAIVVALIFRTLDALRIFDLPYVLTNGAAGTNTLSLYAYRTFSLNRDYGYGATLSVLTFVLVMAVSYLYIRVAGRNLRELAAEA